MQTKNDLKNDIQLCNYWIYEFKKVLRQAKEYGLSMNEIKQYGESIKKYRSIIKQKINF